MTRTIRRRTVLAAIIGVAAVLPAALPAAAQDEPLDIAFLSPSFDISDAFERTYWAMRGRLDEAGVAYDVTLNAVANTNDHPGQLAQVEAVIARAPDYVVLTPTEYQAATTALRQLKAAGIPTIVYNFLEPHEDESVRAMHYIAFDHFEGGRLAGAWAALALNGQGKIAILQGSPGVTSDSRRDGFRQVVDHFPGIEVIVDVHTDYDRVKAFEATQNLIAAHDDLRLVYGVSTTIGLGAGQAIRQAGLSEQIMSIGFGGTGDEITAIQEGWLSASPLRSIDDGGVAAAEAILRHLNGEEVPPSWGGPFMMIDAGSEVESILLHSNRYSGPAMGR
ncbi:MAG: sugar ABC transporter substrate-binding protein [Alphaproteobacteria bacterium]